MACWSNLGSPSGGKKVVCMSFSWDDRAWLVELSLKITNLEYMIYICKREVFEMKYLGLDIRECVERILLENAQQLFSS